MENKKVFFSYSRADGSDFALRLASELKKAGYNVWIDQEDIRAGSEWDLEIEKALETCDCLLFIESEQSVVSNNVLDEVYYALEQDKKVIPVILHDSKTPFRLQRLQHIDFTKSFDEGLRQLIEELNGKATSDFFQATPPERQKSESKVSLSKMQKISIVIACMAILLFAVIFFSTRNNNITGEPAHREVKRVETPEQEVAVNTNDEPSAKVSEKETVAPPGDNRKEAAETVNLLDAFAGEWKLVEVRPAAGSYKGYLKIEPSGSNKATIKSYVQFFYVKSNDTAFLSVFNGFAGCSNCLLQKDMKLITEDAAVATQVYKILKENDPAIGKAGDTVMNAGSNKSIRAKAMLHLDDRNTVVIKISRDDPAELSHGMVLKPFVYTFRFRKTN